MLQQHKAIKSYNWHVGACRPLVLTHMTRLQLAHAPCDCLLLALQVVQATRKDSMMAVRLIIPCL